MNLYKIVKVYKTIWKNLVNGYASILQACYTPWKYIYDLPFNPIFYDPS